MHHLMYFLQYSFIFSSHGGGVVATGAELDEPGPLLQQRAQEINPRKLTIVSNKHDFFIIFLSNISSKWLIAAWKNPGGGSAKKHVMFATKSKWEFQAWMVNSASIKNNNILQGKTISRKQKNRNQWWCHIAEIMHYQISDIYQLQSQWSQWQKEF